ncbi:MAG: ABC transporter ATP-binding protein [Acidimicrobiia bacterium]|nr:ABC transporter ATP-binding protein [Acidimicrobiia bacterium]
MSAIAVRDLTVAYNGKPVLDGVDLVVSAGELVAVIGPNGAGKTTLLRAIAGMIPIRSGEARVDGKEIGGLNRRQAARSIALVPQDPVIPRGMTCFDYVLLGRSAYIGYLASESAADRRTAMEALERLEATEFAERPIDRLSGGERQRVVLARAIAQDAAVLLLDEPTTALDIGHQQNVLDLVDGLRRDHGIAVLAAFHDLNLAAQYADRMVLLVDGEVMVDGSPATVLRPESLALFSGARATVIAGPHGEPIVVPLRR